MQIETIIEERVTFAAGRLGLSGVLGYPATATPVRAVLICPPHPHFAGDMNNNVVRALARRLSAEAVTLRFDYRGVADSEIDLPPRTSAFDYWHDVEESKNYADVLADVAAAADELAGAGGGLPLSVLGYSFGSAVGLMHGCEDGRVECMVAVAPPLTRVSFSFLASCEKPCLVFLTKGDFLYSDEEVASLRCVAGPGAQVCVQPAGDHFFRGEEDRISAIVEAFVRDRTLPECEGSN